MMTLLLILGYSFIQIIVKLIQLYSDEKEQLSKNIQEFKMSKEYKSQSQKVFDSIEEGIIVLTDGSVSFMNNVFKQILEPFNRENQEIQNIKLFKNNKEESEEDVDQNILSLGEIIQRSRSQRDNIYQMMSEGDFFK